MKSLLVRLVSRVPARVETKLLASFLTIVVLLIVLGAVGLRVLSGVNQRTVELVKLQRKIAAYRQVQHDTTNQLYSVTSALLLADQRSLDAALRRVSQFGYDLERLQFVAKDEVELLGQVRQEYDRFVDVARRVVELIRGGNVAEAREVHLAQAAPLADRLERLTNQLVNRAEASMVAGIDASEQAYVVSQLTVIAFAIGSIVLALALGYAISWSLIGPVAEIDARLRQVAAGDFTGRVRVANRDELGALAANVNRTCEELARLYQQLEAASRHKSEFLANTSHELRTPLNAILGYAELIEDNIYGEVPDKIREVLNRIQSNGRHLLGLINDVLDLSKIEAGQLSLSIADYSMKEVVQTVVTATGALADEKNLAFSTMISEDLPVGEGDERRITQVLLNLVGNAIKFTEAGGIAVRALAENGAFEVAVSDTGPGIPPEEHQRIFEEFRQLDSSSTRTKGGTGLGLAISKKIVELHGGRIWVDSDPGSGATFHFTLPVRMEVMEDAV
ncbi:MAG TPA: ATP-binding protein [Acetobacteraceae bacterium]|nr:ATP-binding protein [Acetobacteraceae bacterium]